MSAGPKSVVIAAGGTAGHVNPALALAQKLERERVAFIGTPGGLEAKLVPAAGCRFEAIVVRGFDRARPLSLAATGITAVRATRTAAKVLRRLHADVVVGMGGYVS